MKKKENKKEIEEKERKEEENEIISNFETINIGGEWLLALMGLALFSNPKRNNETTINIYTGSDK